MDYETDIEYEYKDKHKFSQNRAKNAVTKRSYTLMKIKRITFFYKQRKSCKKEKYLNQNTFNNTNAIKKTLIW